MRRMTTLGGRWWALGLLLTFGLASPAGALYLDDGQNVSVRARLYSQAAIRTNDSQYDTAPITKLGQVIQHRNFFNPELDAKLTSYVSGMASGPLSWLAPDDFGFRIAAWGFYDGIYDYGPAQFDTSQRLVNSTFPNLPTAARLGVNPDIPVQPFYIEGPRFNPKGKSYETIFPGYEIRNPRDIVATQRRVNELYLSYSKGPLFVRVGKQTLSWGESDTVALLDMNNPFDTTLGAPGVFEDTDEARIPLWTLRTSLQMFDSIGPLSSGFIEAYWVPGDIDTNIGITPTIAGISPYSAPQPNQQSMLTGLNYQAVMFDKLPRQRFENSRWGVRAQTIVARGYTVSGWFYTTFPNAPVPLKLPAVATTGRGACTGGGDRNCATLFPIATIHEMIGVVGASTTFFSEPLNSIVRIESEYFMHQAGFIPEVNLGESATNPLAPLSAVGKVPYYDSLGWEVGLDRNFFIRPLNPNNSFLLVTAIVGSWNMSENADHDFRMNGSVKQGASGQSPADYVQQKKVETFAQMHLQTDYLHGRLTPSVTLIQNARGTFVAQPSVSYRWADSLLFSLNYTTIQGEFQQLGFFRDRDQVAVRATYQLN